MRRIKTPSFESPVLTSDPVGVLVEEPRVTLFAPDVRGRRAPNLDLSAGGTPSTGGAPGIGDVALPEGIPLPFFTSSYEVSSQLVTSVFNNEDGVWPRPSQDWFIAKANWPVPSLSYECHSQGIAVGPSRALMSCRQQRLAGGGERQGWLLVLDTESDEMWLKPIGDGTHTHPAVGQPVYGATVRDRLGRSYPAEMTMLVPVVNSRDSDGNRGCAEVPNIDLFDENGDWVFGFCHEPFAGAEGMDRRDLACCAMLARGGKLYLAAIRNEHLYIYRLHWFGPASRRAYIEVRQLVVQDVNQLERVDGGAGTRSWRDGYNSMNFFRNKQGQLFLMCGRQAQGHGSVCDVWRIDGAWRGNTSAPTGEPHKWDPSAWTERPTFVKVASGGRRNAPDPYGEIKRKGLFYEGFGIAKFSDYHMGIWLLPHDFKHRMCGALINTGRLCTYGYYYDACFTDWTCPPCCSPE